MKPNELVGKITGGAVAIAIALAAAGCTRVPLTAGGEGVRVAREAELGSCEKLGKTKSKTTTRVLFFARSDQKVRQELASLARNEAAEMGGDAIAPLGPPAEGRQSFAIHRCAAR